eukprot:SAG11_NODE_217_length_12229_cov_9.152185_4_plen_43_part_00
MPDMPRLKRFPVLDPLPDPLLDPDPDLDPEPLDPSSFPARRT